MDARTEKIFAVLEEIVAKLIAMFKQTSEWFESLELDAE